jgi:hypothetical protein
VDAAVEHVDERLDDEGPRAAVAEREHVGAQQQHGARLFFRQRGADAARVAAHEVQLQLAQLGRADADVGQLAEARVDAVDDAARPCNVQDDAARLLGARPRLRRERHLLTPARHADNLFE